MQIKLTTILTVAALLAVLIFTVSKLFKNDADIIEGRMDRLCDLASLSEQESSLNAGMRAKEISDYFTAGIEIRAESAPISISSRHELRRMIFKARTSLNNIDVDPRKLEVTVNEDGKKASMFASIRIGARGPQGSETFREAFNIEWINREGKWKIADIDRHETIHLVE